MSLAFDGSGSSNASNSASSLSATISTSGADRIIVAVINLCTNSSTPTTVSTVADGNGLTWHKRSSERNDYPPGSSQGMSMEVWWAHAPTSLSSDSVTVTPAATTQIAMQLFAVSGADVSAPWDTSLTLPFTMAGFSNGGNVERVPFAMHSTTAPASWLFVFANTKDNTVSGTALSSPWVEDFTSTGASGGEGVGVTIWHNPVSSAQNNTYTDLTNFPVGLSNGVYIADAMVPAGSTPGSDVVGINGTGYAATHQGVTPWSAFVSNKNAGDLLVGYFGYDSSTASPTIGVTDTAGNTWTKLTTVLNTTTRNNSYMDIWYTVTTAAVESNEVTMTPGTGTFAQQYIQIVSIANADTSSPFDSGSPFTANDPTGNSAPIVTGISSTVTEGLLLVGAWTDHSNAYISWSGASSPALVNLGSTNINADNDWATNGLSLGVISGSALSGYSTGNADNSLQNWAAAAVVIKPAPPPAPNGTWGSTDAKDVAAFTGNLFPTGTFGPTEAKDVFNAISNLQGVWGATESKDMLAFIGYPQLKGTFGATETKDTMAFTGVETPPLSLDTFATGGAGGDGISSGEVTISTNHDNEIICVHVVSGGHFHFGAVTSITDTAGLVWKRRHKRAMLGSEPFVELWWAHAPTPLSADVITVNTATTGAIAITAFGVAGANTTTPWDINTRAPWEYEVTGGNPTSNLYTSAAKTMMLMLWGTDGVGTAGTVGAPFTFVTATSESEHVGDTMTAALAYSIASSPQSNVAVQFGESGGTFNNRGFMTDAIVAADEFGTADEVYWFFDADSGATNILSTTADNQSMPVTGITFFNADLMVVVAVMIQSASGLGQVTSVNDNNGDVAASPGYQRRSRVTDPTGLLALEVWWGYSPAAFNNNTVNIHTTETAPGDTISAIVIGVGNTAASIASGDPFWDGDSNLPAVNDSDTGGGTGVYPHVATLSTITQNCLLLGISGNTSTDESTGATQPFFPGFSLASAGPPANLDIEFMFSAPTVNDQLVEFDVSPSPHTWVMVADAIPVGVPVPPNGVWGSTEPQDKFTHTGDFTEIGIASPGGWVGFPPITGVVAATDQKDLFTGAPAQAPYDSIGWLGWVPAFCTLNGTDRKDVASFGGWILGSGGISGRLGTIDAPDRWSFSNIATVTGTLGTTELRDRWASAGFVIPEGTPPAPRRRRMLIIT